MNYHKKERRKHARYDTEAKVYFRVNYDIKTKVKFQVVGKDKLWRLSKKYPALTRDISAEGLGLSSDKRIKKGDILYLEVYLPGNKAPVCMTGEVYWSKLVVFKRKPEYKFSSGVKLITVSGEPVCDSIHYDEEHRVVWSVVLESIFGSFRKLMRKAPRG